MAEDKTETLLECLREDLRVGVISSEDNLKVVRKRSRKDSVQPIIDYFYEDSKVPNGIKFEKIAVVKVLEELIIYNMNR